MFKTIALCASLLAPSLLLTSTNNALADETAPAAAAPAVAHANRSTAKATGATKARRSTKAAKAAATHQGRKGGHSSGKRSHARRVKSTK